MKQFYDTEKHEVATNVLLVALLSSCSTLLNEQTGVVNLKSYHKTNVFFSYRQMKVT